MRNQLRFDSYSHCNSSHINIERLRFPYNCRNVSIRTELFLNNSDTIAVMTRNLPVKLIIHGIWADCDTDELSIPVIEGEASCLLLNIKTDCHESS